MTRTPLAAVAALLLLACGGTGTREEQQPADRTPSADLPDDVRQAVTVADAIATAPYAVDSILSAHGLSAQGFDSLMYAIALDSAKSAAYANARRR